MVFSVSLYVVVRSNELSLVDCTSNIKVAEKNHDGFYSPTRCNMKKGYYHDHNYLKRLFYDKNRNISVDKKPYNLNRVRRNKMYWFVSSFINSNKCNNMPKYVARLLQQIAPSLIWSQHINVQVLCVYSMGLYIGSISF